MDARPLKKAAYRECLLSATYKSSADLLHVCGVTSRFGSDHFGWRTMNAERHFDRTPHGVKTAHVPSSRILRSQSSIFVAPYSECCDVSFQAKQSFIPTEWAPFFVEGYHLALGLVNL